MIVIPDSVCSSALVAGGMVLLMQLRAKIDVRSAPHNDGRGELGGHPDISCSDGRGEPGRHAHIPCSS